MNYENEIRELNRRLSAIESILNTDTIGQLKAILLYIGNIEQVQIYANSLQETLDRYVSPLYIEKTDNTGASLFIDSYLGDPTNIPAYSLIKVRASHTFKAKENEESTIVFKKGETVRSYALKKMKIDEEGKKSLVKLDDGDYVIGNIYEIYFDSQNVAVISSSNAGVTALGLVQTLSKTVEGIQKTLEGLGFEGNDLNLEGKLIAKDLEVTNAKVSTNLDISTVKSLSLPASTTIQNPTTNTGVANKQYVDKAIEDYTLDFFGKKHIVDTGEANTVMQLKENDSFYFKIGD
jgi:hypothetical protein